MEGTLRCTLGSQARHAHSLEVRTQFNQQTTSTHNKHFHNIPQQNNNHTQTYCVCFTKQFMFKTALNNNIIPHTWKLANIVPIPKPDTDKGTSYRPISIFSVIANTLEKSLIPYITVTIPNTPMHYVYKTQHCTVTTLHTLNNTVAKGFNQMAPPARTITVALDMSKVFDTINIHTLIRKLLQTNIPGTIIKFIAKYIKGRKAYNTSRQRQFNTGVPQGGVLSPTLFNIYTSDLPPPSAPVQVMAYA